MRIYRGSDADIVLRPFMVRLSEIVSFDLQLWTSGTCTVKRSTSESGMTTDKENNLINVHFTDKETGYLDAGVLNAKLMYRITDSEYPDGTYDGIITIPQEYYLMTPPDFSGATIEKVYESGYTEGYNTAIQNSVLSINGEKGDLKLKTVNGNELLGEGNINIKALKYFELTQERAREAYDEIQNHWDDKSGYTGDFIFYYKKENRSIYTFDEVGVIKDHSVYFNYLNNADAYDVNIGNIKFFTIIIWKDGYNLQTYENDFAIPTKTSQLTNDSAFQTKSEVDTAIENAISGCSGDQNVIVLDGLTQEEVKAIYDKLDKTKSPDVVFVYLGSYSFRTYWDGEENLNFDIFRSSYEAIELSKVTVTKTGEIYRGSEVQSYTNSCVIQVNSHINETDPFECSYIGSFLEYLQRVYNKPYAYFIWFKQGYGASTKPAYVPFSLIWDKDPDAETGPVNIQFTIDGITYKYRNDLTDQNTWQYDGKISIYDSHSINGYNGTSLVLGDAALDATDKNKYIDMRAMMGHDTIFNGDNDGSCPYLTIITTDNQMYKVPVWVKCNKQNDSTTRATFEFDLNGYHYLYTQDNQGEFTYSFTSKTPIGGGTSGDVPTKVSQLENDANYATQSEIPTTTSELTNNSGFITIADVPTKVSQLENDSKYATQSELPKKTSELTNDSGYITISDVPTKVSELENDANYATQSEIPTKVSQLQNDANYAIQSELPKKTSELTNDSGFINSFEVSNIKVLSQSEYDALTPKDPNTLYCIKGQ